MAKKPITIFVLASFCFFQWTCFPFKTKRIVNRDANGLNWTKSNLAIISVVKRDGTVIDFRKINPGRFDPGGGSVTGRALLNFEMDKKDIAGTNADNKGKIIGLSTVDGRSYQVASIADEGQSFSFSAYAPISIPIGDIQQVWIRKSNSLGLAANIFLWTVFIGGVVFVAALGEDFMSWDSMWQNTESCPFVYSWDGEEYVLDAEPYGAAVTEGLKRTDWIELSNLKAVDNQYRLLLINELDETEFTDELKLVAVDHTPGLTVAADLAGRIHTFSSPLSPSSAVDQAGRDILNFVGKSDRVFWRSELEEKNPDGDGEFRDELTFEFPKPAGAKRAKLLANVWTTEWGARSAGMFMKLYGDTLDEFYGDVDRHGPMHGRVMNWMAGEELHMLKIWVETQAGWKARGMILGGAPFITKDKAIVFDVSDIPGDVLRVRLRPPVNFWTVNSLTVDYGEDSPVHITELAAESAVDHAGRDVRRELATTDGLYHVSPNRGDRTELVFAAPLLKEGLERTVLVKASGYYKVNLGAVGEPRTDLIARVFDEPGFAARHSFREYLHWVAGLQTDPAAAKR